MDPPRLHHHTHLLVLGEQTHEVRVGGQSYTSITVQPVPPTHHTPSSGTSLCVLETYQHVVQRGTRE